MPDAAFVRAYANTQPGVFLGAYVVSAPAYDFSTLIVVLTGPLVTWMCRGRYQNHA